MTEKKRRRVTVNEEKILLSIIIPCYNSGAFLQQTIDMLKREELSECEIIMIDDGSTDNTLDIMKMNISGNIRYITRVNKGVSTSRNDGLRIARGKYIYFLDSDDEIAVGTINYYKQKIYEHPGCDLFSFGYKMIEMDGKEINYVSNNLNGRELMNEECADLYFRGLLFMNICSVLICREFLIEKGVLFEEGVQIGEDSDFLRKVSLKTSRVLYDARICFIYKLRQGSATNGHVAYYEDANHNSLLLSFRAEEYAEKKLSKRTISYFLAARYCAGLVSYLKSSCQSDVYNRFFLTKRYCLYKPMNTGRKRVMLAIWTFRLVPIGILLSIFKRSHSAV